MDYVSQAYTVYLIQQIAVVNYSRDLVHREGMECGYMSI